MINWETTFIQPYTQALSQGTIGNARDHARVLTNLYINSIITGAPQGIPPTLPSGIPPFFPPVPVGPGTFYNTYPSRRKVFEDTIYIYFQGKSLLQGKANIQDLVASYKRLIKQVKQVGNEIKTIESELKTLEENVTQLAPQLAEFWEGLKLIIKDKKDELKSILHGTDNVDFKNTALAEFKQLFSKEINLYNSIINFTITTNPADYGIIRDTLQSAISLYSELNSIVDVRDINKVETNFRKYLIGELVRTIQSIISLIQGFVNPSEVLTQLQDLVALDRYIKYNKVYLIAQKYVVNLKYYKQQKARLQTLLVEKEAKYQYIAEKKLKKLKEEIKHRIDEYKSTSKTYKWFVSKSVVFNQKKKTIKKQKKQIQAKKQKIKKLRLIVTELGAIQQDFNTVVAAIKQEYIKIVKDIDTLKSIPENVVTAGENFTQQLDSIKTMSVEQKINFATEMFGQATSLAAVLMDSVAIKSSIKLALKAKVNEVNADYDLIIDKLLTIIVRIQTLNKLVQFNTDEPDPAVFDKEVLKLQQQEAARINEIIQARHRGKKSTFKGVFKIVNDIAYLVGLVSPKAQQRINDELIRTKKYLKQIAQENKFIKEVAKVNAAISKGFNIKTKVEAEKREKEAKIKQAKKLILEAKYVSKMLTAGVQLGENVATKKLLITQNEQPLTTFINNYYAYQKTAENLTPQTADAEKNKQLKQLEELKNYELFATMLVQLFKDLTGGEFVADAKRVIDSYKSENDTPPIELSTFVDAVGTTKPTVDGLITLLNNLGGEILSNLTNITLLQQVESKYTKKALQIINQYKQTFDAKGTQQQTTTMQRFFKDVQVGGSVILTLLKYFKKYVVEPINVFIKRWIKAQLKKIKDFLAEKRKKLQENKKLFIDKLKEKLINIDAKAMGIMFGLATRLFWTGATWANPVGTTFIVFTIGPFKPIKALPKDGAAGIAKEIGNSFKLQLIPMTGLVTPLPANAIPPFPFVGYN